MYIRNKDEYLFTGMPISRVYLQYKSKEFYFEDTQKTVINFGERHTFTFFYDASMEGISWSSAKKTFLNRKSQCLFSGIEFGKKS